MSSSDLQARARDGDADAFGTLIRDWDHDLRGVVWSVVRNAAMTDDVMVDAYGTAFDNIDRFDGQASMKVWLHTICLRAAIDRSRHGGDDHGASATAEVPGSSAELDQPFDSLDGVERLLVMLTAGLGYDFDDTAAIVGMTKDTVASKVGRARDRLDTRSNPADRADGDHETELHEYLQQRIPEPATGYWGAVDARLRNEGPVAPISPVGEGEGPDTSTTTEDTGAQSASTSVHAIESPTGAPRRNLLIAAVAVVVAGIALFALLNRDDDPADLATAAEPTVEAGDAATTNDTTPSSDSDSPGEDESNDGIAEAEPASPEESAELNAALDQSPLQAIIVRLNGGADSGAGPYCFSHPDSYVFPADELDDRRALLQLDVADDGFANFTAMQGETIVITGAGYPDEAGLLVTTPVAVAGASGAPPYELRIGDDQISVSDGEAALDLVDCSEPTVAGRIDTMFTLLSDPTANWVFDAWPPDDAVLSSAGLGPIRIGMTVAELEVELGTDLTIETIDGNVAGACGWVAATTAIARDVWILVELTGPDDAVIRRVSTFSGPWFTPSGITVGSTQQDVIETFPGQIEELPHVYTDGTYMRFLPSNADDPNTVEFVNEGGTIAEIRVGDREWVGLIEGCA